MARLSYPRAGEPRPEPLPPETRTVGQLVAESIRLYGHRFWRALPLGVGVAVMNQISANHGANVQSIILWAAAPVLAASYVGASVLLAQERPPARVLVLAVAAGTAVFLPVPILLRLYLLPAIGWLAFAGLTVPVVVIERLSPLDAFRRARKLALVDYIHALGSLATLALVYFLSRAVLLFLLRSQADTAVRTAALLADLALAPLLFLGAALLYVDQSARAAARAAR
ncbi:MAG TPA: hypothetical protein VGF23_22150 [Gaiellaceae bacterium]|jgi:hypothetical protein